MRAIKSGTEAEACDSDDDGYRSQTRVPLRHASSYRQSIPHPGRSAITIDPRENGEARMLPEGSRVWPHKVQTKLPAMDAVTDYANGSPDARRSSAFGHSGAAPHVDGYSEGVHLALR